MWRERITARVNHRWPDTPPRILSRADCEALFRRIVGLTTGGGDTSVTIRSTWTLNLSWARNRPTTSGDIVESHAIITRAWRGVSLSTGLDQLDDTTLKETVQSLEQRLVSSSADASPITMLARQEYLTPPIWSDATYQLTAHGLSDAARMSVDPVVDAQLVAAGYMEVGAATWAIFNTRGLNAYAAATGALYTETVRTQDGTGSGWAGRRHLDWAKLDVPAVSATALQKCRASVNPVAIEPGRYTAILDPIVTAVLLACAVDAMNREAAETGQTVYTLTPGGAGQRGISKIDHPVFDSRLTISTDPADPDCGYMPFDPEGSPYRPVTWVEGGILKALPYDRRYARQSLGTDTALPNPMAFRVSGGDTSIEEMIATTKRGILVTRLGLITIVDSEQLSLSAVTRDGLFLIEDGKMTHPIKNMWMTESPMHVFNKVLQIGQSIPTVGTFVQRDGSVLRDLPARALTDGYAPVVAPYVKVEDFNFTGLTDAI
jgi:predicted Zn-dependent protease